MSNNPASVNCLTCGACAWSGGAISDDEDRQVIGLPVGELETPDGSVVDLGDAADLLTVWANQHCGRDDCQNTSAGRERARAQDPAVMAVTIADLQAQIARLSGGE